jgi:hypothetical protein
MANGRANAPAFLVLGLNADGLAFAGGVIVPSLDLILNAGQSDAGGGLSLSGTVNADALPGQTFFAQLLVVDPSALRGVAFTNALAGVTPW